METVHCPKCGRPLSPEGEAFCDGRHFPVYSCPECVQLVDFLGQRQELPLTFCRERDAAGRWRVFDPASGDELK